MPIPRAFHRALYPNVAKRFRESRRQNGTDAFARSRSRPERSQRYLRVGDGEHDRRWPALVPARTKFSRSRPEADRNIGVYQGFALMGMLVVLACSTKAQDGGARSEAVREILKPLLAAQSSPGWWSLTTFERGDEVFSYPFKPSVFISCGNSRTGLFSRDEARKLTLRLFEAYGLKLETQVDLKTDSVEARIDGLDRTNRLGFEFQGLIAVDVEDRTAQHRREVVLAFGDLDGVETDSAEHHLSNEEAVELKAKGWQILVGPQPSYHSFDHDDLPALNAWVLGVLDFLNRVTAGEDVRLSDFMGRPSVERRLGVVRTTVPDGGLRESRDWIEFDLKEESQVVFRIQEDLGMLENLREHEDKSGDTDLARYLPRFIEFLELKVESPQLKERSPEFKVVQELSATRDLILFSPSTFIPVPREFRREAGFTCVAELPPGHHRVSKRILLVQSVQFRRGSWAAILSEESMVPTGR